MKIHPSYQISPDREYLLYFRMNYSDNYEWRLGNGNSVTAIASDSKCIIYLLYSVSAAAEGIAVDKISLKGAARLPQRKKSARKSYLVQYILSSDNSGETRSIKLKTKKELHAIAGGETGIKVEDAYELSSNDEVSITQIPLEELVGQLNR